MQRTFPAETIRHLTVANIAGALVVRGWEERTISVECEVNIPTLKLEGETLIVGGAEDGVIISRASPLSAVSQSRACLQINS